jgi:hypothetical protein
VSELERKRSICWKTSFGLETCPLISGTAHVIFIQTFLEGDQQQASRLIVNRLLAEDISAVVVSYGRYRLLPRHISSRVADPNGTQYHLVSPPALWLYLQ